MKIKEKLENMRDICELLIEYLDEENPQPMVFKKRSRPRKYGKDTQ